MNPQSNGQKPLVTIDSDGTRLLYCEACESHHVYDNRWEWNGDLHKPTFSPSLIVEIKDFNGSGKTHICHSFVVDGVIRYLADSTHKFKGTRRKLLPI